MIKLQPGINNCTNSEYHSSKEYLSSSSYKMLLQSPYQFHQEFILGNQKKEKEKDHLKTGSLLHSRILEPHLVDVEYIAYPGPRRAGTEYEAFAAQHKDKIIVTQAQWQQTKWLEAGYKRNSEAVRLIREPGSLYEHTVVIPDYKGVPSKVRADSINVEHGYITDVKTTGFELDPESIKATIVKWDYALSSALYCELMSQFYGKKFDFYWIFCGKKSADCAVYRMSEKTRDEGLERVFEAARIYRYCIKTQIWEHPKKSFHYDLDVQDI